MNSTIFKEWLTQFDLAMRRKFSRAGTPAAIAWLILDNSSSELLVHLSRSTGTSELLVHLSRSTGEPHCRITDCEIAGEHISENPDPDMELVEENAAEDEETDGCLPGLELAGSEAAGGPRRTITLQQARIAALDVLNFCLDNQDHAPCNSHAEWARRISEMLQSMTTTAHHQQKNLDSFWRKP
jgi:hypothetical protein